MFKDNAGFFEGEFHDGVPEGYGTFEYKPYKYNGNFMNGKRFGNGVFVIEDRFKAIGFWDNNFMQGEADVTLSNGNSYAGDMLCSKPHGMGKYSYENGSYYEGEFKQGLREGRGSFFDMSGWRYIGDWKQDKRDGKGHCLRPADEACFEIYDGNWKDDKEHGSGSLTIFSNGRKVSSLHGNWEFGKSVEKA
jgi:hypothetical protein